MTREQKQALAKDPRKFLESCWYHEAKIESSLETIQHYRDIAESITAEIKEAPSFGSGPSSKIENCVLEIVELENDIAETVKALRSDFSAVKEAINLLPDTDERFLMESRYIHHMKWGDIADTWGCTYSWVMKQHKKILKKIQKICSSP